MKRIIVEGMDSTGKGTLIEHLHSEFHFLRTVVNELGPEQDFDKWWPEQLNDPNYPTFVPLHDRFFYSELVYGPLLRGYVKATQATQTATLWALRHEAFVIFCRPDTETIIRTLTNKPQMEGVFERAHRLIRGYDDLMWEEQRHYGRRFYHYDWEEPKSLQAVTTLIEEYLLGENQ